MERSEQMQRLEAQSTTSAVHPQVLESMARLVADLALTTDRLTLIRRPLEMVMSVLPNGHGIFYGGVGDAWGSLFRWETNTMTSSWQAVLPDFQGDSFPRSINPSFRISRPHAWTLPPT